MELFVSVAVFMGLGMLMWDCIEVGRNDAANIVNAVFGSRILRRRVAVGSRKRGSGAPAIRPRAPCHRASGTACSHLSVPRDTAEGDRS